MEKNKGLKVLYLIGFLLSASVAFPGYIRSSFLEEFVDLKWIGLFFLGSALFSLIAIDFFPYYIKKFSNYRLAVFILFIHIISILLLITVHSVIWVFVYFVISGVASYLMFINLDVFVERFTANPTTGKIRTVYFTFLNLGWLISPIIVGYLLGEGNYRLVFLISVIFQIIAITVMLASRKKLEDHLEYEHHRTLTTLKNIWRNPDLRGIFTIAFLLEMFYVIAVIYMPIYLHENIGFSWQIIGIIFTFMLLPFVVLEIPAGSFADKYSGEKKVLMLGFMILIASVSLFFLTESTAPLIWGVILFLSRCGAALVESMRESYFFKTVDVKDIDYINFFRNVSPLAYLVGSGLSILVLKFYPIQLLFFFLALLLISGLFFTSSLSTIITKKVRANRKRSALKKNDQNG